MLFRTLLILHIVTGTLAVIIGGAALAVRKPVGVYVHRHRSLGRLFQRLMIAVLGTAAAMTILRFSPYFAGLTAAAALGVFSGQRVLRRKRGERAEAVDWIVTLAITAVATFLGVLLARGEVARNVPVVRALSYGTLTYALYDVYRFIRPKAWPFTPRLWLYEHIVKMIGGYSGAVAAFSGSVLVVFPPPWRQLWATVSGWILAVVMVVYYARQGRRAAA